MVMRLTRMTDSLKTTSATDAAAKPTTVGTVAPRTSSKLDYARDQASALQRWARRTFSPENVLAFFKTAAWVAPLTILIWVYAEREQVAKKPDVTIPIAIKSVDPNRIVQLRISGSAIMAELVGPRAQVDRVYDLVTRPGEDPAVQIELPRNYTPVQGKIYTVDTARLIGDHPIFRSRGVLLSDCKPFQLEFTVDELIEREVEVKLPPRSGQIAATFEPRTVKVRGPKAILTGPDTLAVYADLSGRSELRTQGHYELGTVPLTCTIDNPSLRLEPASVKATVDVSQLEESFTIDAIPVWPAHPPSLLDNYKVEMTPTITKIKVVGPSDKIELLRNKSFLPKAYLDVTDEDKNKPQQQKLLKFDLPEGVAIAPEDLPKTKWSFRVVKNSSD
jgi:hypothetical protein